MSKHVFYTGDSLKLQYSYGLKESGTISFEVMTTDSPDYFRVILRKDDDVVYDRDISVIDIDTFDYYLVVPKVSNDLLNAGYIASLWNHRMLYLMYGEGDGTMYQAAAAICNAMVICCYDYHRLGFLPLA